MFTSYRVIELVRRAISNQFLTASDTDVANALGLSRAAVSAYKHGKGVMSAETFAKALDLMHLDELEAAEITMRLMTEQSKTEPEKQLWGAVTKIIHGAGKIAKATGGKAAATLAASVLALMAATAGNKATAATVEDQGASPSLYITSKRRRQSHRMRLPRVSWLRWLIATPITQPSFA